MWKWTLFCLHLSQWHVNVWASVIHPKVKEHGPENSGLHQHIRKRWEKTYSEILIFLSVHLFFLRGAVEWPAGITQSLDVFQPHSCPFTGHVGPSDHPSLGHFQTSFGVLILYEPQKMFVWILVDFGVFFQFCFFSPSPRDCILSWF